MAASQNCSHEFMVMITAMNVFFFIGLVLSFLGAAFTMLSTFIIKELRTPAALLVARVALSNFVSLIGWSVFGVGLPYGCNVNISSGRDATLFPSAFANANKGDDDGDDCHNGRVLGVLVPLCVGQILATLYTLVLSYQSYKATNIGKIMHVAYWKLDAVAGVLSAIVAVSLSVAVVDPDIPWFVCSDSLRSQLQVWILVVVSPNVPVTIGTAWFGLKQWRAAKRNSAPSVLKLTSRIPAQQRKDMLFATSKDSNLKAVLEDDNFVARSFVSARLYSLMSSFLWFPGIIIGLMVFVGGERTFESLEHGHAQSILFWLLILPQLLTGLATSILFNVTSKVVGPTTAADAMEDPYARYFFGAFLAEVHREDQFLFLRDADEFIDSAFRSSSRAGMVIHGSEGSNAEMDCESSTSTVSQDEDAWQPPPPVGGHSRASLIPDEEEFSDLNKSSSAPISMQQVVFKYVKEGSEYELNISALLRSRLLRRQDLPSLQAVRQEVLDQLQLESFPEFCRSRWWDEMMASLHRRKQLTEGNSPLVTILRLRQRPTIARRN